MGADVLQMVGLACASVGLWTLRVAVAASGRKLVCALVAALEALVFVFTFSRLVTDLGSPGRVIGYVVGVAAGSVIGLVLNERLTTGHSEMQLIAPGRRPDVVATLHAEGWPATWSVASGPDGDVTMVWLTVDDGEISHLVDRVEQLEPRAFWTLQVKASVAPTGVVTRP